MFCPHNEDDFELTPVYSFRPVIRERFIGGWLSASYSCDAKITGFVKTCKHCTLPKSAQTLRASFDA